MIYLETDCAKVIHHKDTNTMEIFWLDFANTENYQKVFDVVYEVIKKHKTPFWLSDMRQAKVVKIENREWLQTVFIPKVFALDILRKGAYILSENAFNKMYLESIKKDLEKQDEYNFETKYFTDRESALTWLIKDIDD